jgi:hypothetical protein
MRTAIVGLFLAVLVLGCADARRAPEGNERGPVAGHQVKDKEVAAQAPLAAEAPPAQEPAGQPRPAGAPAAEEVQKKIIFTAHLDLVVQDIDKAQANLEQSLEEVKGYVAKSEIRGAPGSPRDGTWTLRVPVAQFDTLRKSLIKLGIIRRNAVDSEDITDRFYDIQARLKNNQAAEERLRKLEDKAAGKTEDVLAILREQNNLRGTIEGQQNQINCWNTLTRYATIELHLKEDRDYMPPSHPGFGSSISGTFWGSVEALTNLGKGVVLVLVALTPWLPLLALLAAVLWVVRRRLAST